MGEEQTQSNENTANHLGTILKELSDIKASLAVNTNETANVKASVNEMKADIKEIKNDFVSRREHSDSLKAAKDEAAKATQAVKDEIQPLKKFVYGVISIMGAIILGAILNQVIK